MIINRDMYNRVLKFINNSFLADNIDNIAFIALLSILFVSVFSPSEVIGVLSLIFSFIIIFKKIIKEDLSFDFSSSKKAIVIYFLLVTMSLFGSTLFKLSLHGYLKTCVYILFFFCVCDYFKNNKNKIFPTLFFICALASFEAFVAILQNHCHVAEISSWQDMSNINPEDVISRAYGTLKPYNPNLLAGYLLCALSSFVYLILHFLNQNKKRLSLLFSILFLIALVAITDTGCRGAYLGFLLFFPCLAFFLIYYVRKKFGSLKNIKKRYKNLSLGAVFLFLVFVFSNPAIVKRFTSIFALRADSSISFRLNVYQSCINMFSDNPFLGIGVGNQNFREIYGLYMKTGFDALGSYCVPLEIAVESGIFALGAFLLFLFFVVKKCLKVILKDFNSNEEKILCLCALLMILAVFGHGLFDTIWFRPQVQILFWTIIAMTDSVKAKKLIEDIKIC